MCGRHAVNAAEIAVPDAVELAAQLSGARAHMLQVLRQSLQLLRQTLQTFSESRILRNPAAAVQDKRMELDLLHRKLTGPGRRLTWPAGVSSLLRWQHRWMHSAH